MAKCFFPILRNNGTAAQASIMLCHHLPWPLALFDPSVLYVLCVCVHQAIDFRLIYLQFIYGSVLLFTVS